MRWYDTHVMGTGPFVFVEHVKGSHWVGKRNPNYWDKGKPYLDGYRAIFIKDSAAQVSAVRGERAHIQFRGFSPAERDNLVAALGPKIAVQESPWDCALLVAMNHEKKPFDDKRVRRALTLALDRYQGSQALSKIAIVKEVPGGDGLPVRLHRRARPRPLQVPVEGQESSQLQPVHGQGARRALRKAEPCRRRGGAQEGHPGVRAAAGRRGSALPLHAAVAPDHPAQRSGARLDGEPEPLSEPAARHGVACWIASASGAPAAVGHGSSPKAAGAHG